MDFKQWQASLSGQEPPAGLPALAEAMWWESRGDWQRAHAVAQDVESREGAWVHAYLHRREGNDGNAGYWYRRAGKPHCREPLEQERDVIVKALLTGGEQPVQSRRKGNIALNQAELQQTTKREQDGPEERPDRRFPLNRKAPVPMLGVAYGREIRSGASGSTFRD